MIEERAILAALERIARMQDSIRSGMDICRDTGLVFLRVYYEQLPPNVARRLTELHAEDMAEIPRATSTEGTAQDRQRLGEKLASDAAHRTGHAGGECLPRKARLRPAGGRRRHGSSGR